MERSLFDMLVTGWIILACITFPVLLFVVAPYGRHTGKNHGIMIPNKLGWLIMELPALLVFVIFILSGTANKNIVLWIISATFTIHYINRSLIYPFRTKTTGKKIPLLIVISGIGFNLVNSSINGYFAGTLQCQYKVTWLTDPRFISGLLLFFTGMIINLWSDGKLIQMRKTSGNEYRIPFGGLFNLISCPNFFGEIIEWLGFALLCWSLPSLSFLIWTCCNLVPRALDHHRWYKRFFPTYPAERKAIFPYLI